jgi:hypothetical protein
MESIKEILIRRDGMSEEDAQNLIADARINLAERLGNGEQPYDICEEWFGLEPDYIMELLP